MISAGRASEILRDELFPEMKRWIIQTTGLSYYQDKDRDLAAALDRCYPDEKPLAPAQLFERIQSSKADLATLAEELTIGETFFFRHLEMFHALRDIVFPDLAKRNAHTRTLRIWSAGCSIGAEPYSISILLRTLLAPQFSDWNIDILGTDINRRFLRVARSATYDSWALRGLPVEILGDCFHRKDGKWLLAPHCRQGVHFREHNLANDPPPLSGGDLSQFDLIICRNVMIYFDQLAIRRLVDQFHQALIPGGWLAVGHAEPHTDIFRAFHTLNAPGAVLYQKRKPGEHLTAEKAPHLPLRPPLSHKLPSSPLPTVASRSKQPPTAPPPPQPQPRTPVPLSKIPRHPSVEAVVELANSGQLLEALKQAEHLTLIDPLLVEAHFYLGLIASQLGNWPLAERALEKCLYLKRDLALAHYYHAQAALKLGKSAQRSLRNAAQWLNGKKDDELVPLGHGLTAGELRSLLNFNTPKSDE